jgi:hypothetical protein
MTPRLPRLWMVIPFTCLLLISLSPLGSLGQPSPQGSSGTGTAARSLNLLITVQGDVTLSRTTWAGYHPTMFGTTLQHGDLLQLRPGSKAAVLCADLRTIWHIPPGRSSLTEGCPELPEPVLKRGRELIIATRSLDTLQGPYVISPSNTKVLPDRLSLHWQGVPGASTYLVRVVPTSGSAEVVWEQTVSNTKVPYTGPPLKPQGVYNYKVTVQVVNDPSGRRASEGLGFTPLRDDEVARVTADRRKLEALPLPREAQTLALTYLYMGYELRAEAMQTLLEAMAQGRSYTVPYTVATYTILGRLAREMRLPHEAEHYYTQASQLAERTQNIESQASIQEGLGYVYKALKEATKAKVWFERAQASYRQLGDKQRLNEIAEQLGYLPRE